MATVRLTNNTQISDKVPRVTGTQLAVVTAGRRDELAYQIVKRTKELRRDMESDLLRNNIKVASASGTAGELAGIQTWVATNTSHGSGGSAGATGGTARTEGTARAITEDLVKTQFKNCWDNGGDPDCILTDSFNKQQISEFTGNATRFKGAEDRKLVATIDYAWVH